MKLQNLLSSSGVLAAAIAMTAVAPAQAATTIVVSPSNTQGWVEADVRPGGDINYILDATSPYPNGALQLTTDATNQAKAQYMHQADVALSEVTELSYHTKQNTGPVHAAASYQLAVDLNGDAAGGFTTLVYEPYWNGTVVANSWQQWDVDAGQFWSSSTFTDGVCSVTNGAGGPPFYTLANLQTNCPNAQVLGFGVNVGSFNPGYDVEVDGVVFNDTVYDFELNYPTSGEITNPAADGETVSGIVNFTAIYDDGDQVNDDAVQWAIRQGTCASGSNTVAGNVDGYSDAYAWDGSDFSAAIDTSQWTSGSYCFIFNPTDDAGQNNVRETRLFKVEQTVFLPTSKDDCKKGGYLSLTDSNGNYFRNQGQCVSYFNHLN